MVLGMFFQLVCESEGQIAKRKKGGDMGEEWKPSKKRGKGRTTSTVVPALSHEPLSHKELLMSGPNAV